MVRSIPPQVVSSESPSNLQDSSGGNNQHRPKGLKNVGNTCYANAALQCLLSTALTQAIVDPKASSIFRRYSSNPNLLLESSSEGEIDDKCKWLTTELKSIALEYHDDTHVSPSNPLAAWFLRSDPIVNPEKITRYPNRLSNCLRPYQQEDAHEFLRHLLSTLVMNGQNRQLSSLFDGLLESAVTCQTCGRPSLTRDRYMDLSLDIQNSNTLVHALQEFTSSELLSGENKVFCEYCSVKRSATKALRLATAPSILVCHLKRFAFDRRGSLYRLSKRVDFPLQLEIGDYMSKVNMARPPPYELVAVLVHQGRSCESGHYVAFVKNNGNWYCCNDEHVQKVDTETVLKQQAYILMYEVADMRENHGYPSPNKAACTRAWREENMPRATSSMFCGLGDYFFSKDCCYFNSQVYEVVIDDTCRVRSKGSSRKMGHHEDWETVGESTLESDETRIRRTSSSNGGPYRKTKRLARHNSFSTKSSKGNIPEYMPVSVKKRGSSNGRPPRRPPV